MISSSGGRTSGAGGDGTGGGSPPGANSRPPEEGLAAIVEQRGWGLDRTAPRRGRPPRANPGAKRATSVHLYGIRIGEVDDRDYDPYRNYVCDRASA